MAELATRPDALRPVAATERIPALDVLRGIAVLGILVMNVQSFALPFAAYSNPSVWTSGRGLDLVFWGLAHLFAEQKFMTLFSLLFGSGVALMLDRLEARGAPAAKIHYRRTFGLLLIGLAHAYLLWYGDILVSYALCALFLYPVRHVRPSRLLVAGIVLILVAPVLSQGFGVWVGTLPESARQEVLSGLVPSEAEVLEEVEAYRGGWLVQMPVRAATAAVLQTFGFVFFVLWRAGGLMLVGMAFYRWGVVTAESSAATYRRMAAWGFLAGLPLVVAGLVHSLREDFSFEATWLTSGVLNFLGSLGMSLGYLALVMLWCRPRTAAGEPVSAPPAPPNRGAQRRLAMVGRMALTHYLLQTVLCTLVFYGFGLGLFGSVGRAGQWLVVLTVWAFQIAVSPWWLARFRFGPAEWLWRSFTYLRWQPLRR